MNYLQLVQRLSRDAGVNATGPTTVVGQVGEYLHLVDWINDAYMDVLRKPVMWDFLFGSFSFACQVSGPGFARDYSKTYTIGKADRDTVTLYDTSEADERELNYMDYSQFRQVYDVGQWPANRPRDFTILPNGDLRLGPTPDKAYTVTGDYRADRDYMTVADASTPLFDAEYHIMLVYKALMDHADFIQDEFKLTRAAQKYQKLERQLVLEHSKDTIITAETLA